MNVEPSGEGKLLPDAGKCNNKIGDSPISSTANPPIMPPELARECLADAAIAAIGLLQLLAAALQSNESAAAILGAGYGRACIVTMIRETSCHLNGALSDAGM